MVDFMYIFVKAHAAVDESCNFPSHRRENTLQRYSFSSEGSIQHKKKKLWTNSSFI